MITDEAILNEIQKFQSRGNDALHELLDSVINFSFEREKHYQKIIDTVLNYSTKISKEKDLGRLLIILADFGKSIVQSDRATLWLVDEANGVFWTKVAHGLSDIKIPLNAGIVGEVYEKKKTIIVNNPYDHPKFNREIDKQTNYKTESILATPIFKEKGKLLGVFQAINKLNFAQKFDDEDTQLFSIVTAYIKNILDMDDLSESNRYFVEEQTKAAKKQQGMLVNELENCTKLDVFIYFKPYDFLSGDSYSLHKTSTGGYFFYVLDAMGHGIVPSLTSFSVLSFVKQALDKELSFQETADEFGKSLEYILTDLEQLSASFFHIPEHFGYIEYFSAGMYPAVLHDGDKTIELKANNIPFMNFFYAITVSRVKLIDFKSILIYSDGLVEDTLYNLNKQDVLSMKTCEEAEKQMKAFDNKQLEDDLTTVLIERRNV
jgi:serine phosphatase RsbU (regulator of sigma subunit)